MGDKKHQVGWIDPPPPEAAGIQELTDEKGYLTGLSITDPRGGMNSTRAAIRKAIKEAYGRRIPEMLLDDMRIEYDEYSASVTFSSRIPWTPQLGLPL
jgi:hypothetical protein